MNLNYQLNVQLNPHQGIWQHELYPDDVFYDISTKKFYVKDNELEKNIRLLKNKNIAKPLIKQNLNC